MGFNLKVAPLPKPEPAAMSLLSSTPTLAGDVYERTPAQRSEVKALKVVTNQALRAQTNVPGVHIGDKGHFGRLEGREDNPKLLMLKPKQKKLDFLQCCSFLCESIGCFSLGL